MTNRLELNWKLDGFVDEQRYYCSETPIDINNLPTPKVVLAGDIRAYIDTDVVVQTYYVRIGSIKNAVEKISSEKRIVAKNLSNYFMDIDFNGADNSAIYENVSNTVLTATNVSIQNNRGVFSSGASITVPPPILSGDFIISADIDITSPTGGYMNIFNLDNLIFRFGDVGFGYKLQIGMNGSVLEGCYSCALTQYDFSNGVRNLKFSRIGGVCTLKVDDVIQNLGVGANPSSYPYSSFSDTRTPNLQDSFVGNGYVGKMDNFAILKS